MKKSATSFQVLNLSKPAEGEKQGEQGMEHPVLVSFP